MDQDVSARVIDSTLTSLERYVVKKGSTSGTSCVYPSMSTVLFADVSGPPNLPKAHSLIMQVVKKELVQMMVPYHSVF